MGYFFFDYPTINTLCIYTCHSDITFNKNVKTVKSDIFIEKFIQIVLFAILYLRCVVHSFISYVYRKPVCYYFAIVFQKERIVFFALTTMVLCYTKEYSRIILYVRIYLLSSVAI